MLDGVGAQLLGEDLRDEGLEAVADEPAGLLDA